ncbi:transcriptional adapter 2-alpha-like [Watersipora subatra]|uniref:transcriptional adapter 2-alpha-like n=1 Tax=Watersipora subatra TaxID=2589382 RepID=UPI00355B6D55
MDISFASPRCFICQAVLHMPYIKCVECVYILLNSVNQPVIDIQGDGTSEFIVEELICDKTGNSGETKLYAERYKGTPQTENALLCTLCFSTGRSNAVHSANHSYEIIREDFPVIPGSAWAAKEELLLLDAIESCGLGSWSDIAKYVPYRTARECEKHYFHTFINGASSLFPGCRQPPEEYSCFAPYKNTVCSLPPRPFMSSAAYNDISGYMAARGEFATEYDNYAELIIKDVEFTSFEEEGFGSWFDNLKLAMVEIYRYRIFERERRKRIARDHGLLNIRANALYFVGLTKRFNAPLVGTLRKCMRLTKPEEFLKYVESLKTEVRLRQRISRLCEYRSDGITKLQNSKLYEKLRNRRLETQRNRTSLSSCFSVVQDQEAWNKYKLNNAVADKIAKGGVVPHPALARKKAGPLDIVGLPGCEKLTADEKEVCAVARIIPIAYMDFKAILINDCKKEGFLRLAKARTLIKIDVNKTRKIYDLLLKKEIINKDPLS